jgi:hypothetical protein
VGTLAKGTYHLYLRATDTVNNLGPVVDVTITVKSGKTITPN